MQDDVTDATRWAIEQKIAPADRTCIYGSQLRRLCSVDGSRARARAVSLRDRLRRRLRPRASCGNRATFRTRAAGPAYLERMLGTDVAKLRAQSPVYNAQNIKAPVLLIHGKDGRTRQLRACAAHEGGARRRTTRKSSGWRSDAKVTASMTRSRAAKSTSGSCSSSTRTSGRRSQRRPNSLRSPCLLF